MLPVFAAFQTRCFYFCHLFRFLLISFGFRTPSTASSVPLIRTLFSQVFWYFEVSIVNQQRSFEKLEACHTSTTHIAVFLCGASREFGTLLELLKVLLICPNRQESLRTFHLIPYFWPNFT